MTAGRAIPKLIVFALLCLALSFACGLLLEWAARGHGAVPDLLRTTPARFPYFVSVVLCGLLGLWIGMWSRREPLVSALATAACLFAPLGVDYFGNGVSCLRWWECLR
ncbi:MAG TPA: hypothetical protein VMH86_12560 [Rhizomicrobium sp.]|nr:hypothetical protein [Rhizomicrobium sp.]